MALQARGNTRPSRETAAPSRRPRRHLRRASGKRLLRRWISNRRSLAIRRSPARWMAALPSTRCPPVALRCLRLRLRPLGCPASIRACRGRRRLRRSWGNPRPRKGLVGLRLRLLQAPAHTRLPRRSRGSDLCLGRVVVGRRLRLLRWAAHQSDRACPLRLQHPPVEGPLRRPRARALRLRRRLPREGRCDQWHRVRRAPRLRRPRPDRVVSVGLRLRRWAVRGRWGWVGRPACRCRRLRGSRVDQGCRKRPRCPPRLRRCNRVRRRCSRRRCNRRLR